VTGEPVPVIAADTGREAAVRLLATAFAGAGVPEAAFDARLLVCEALGVSRTELLSDPGAALGEGGCERLRAFAARRLAREPVSRIFGRRGFWTFDLEVTPDVLDPRADTETLIDAVVTHMSARRSDSLRIVDLGCGSGAILCALLDCFPNAFGFGVDVSAAACAVATRNLAACGFADRSTVRCGAWSSALPGPYDLVVSNPPYIPTDEIERLDPEVKDHDPRLALDGGDDGLDAYRSITALLPQLLAADGAVALEIGAGQSGAVAALLRAHVAGAPRLTLDHGGNPRVLMAAKG
jgi:release factor glutamine methyltransferase